MSNNCPTCGKIAEIQCRCYIGDSKCASGHDWHYCPVHRVKVAGESPSNAHSIPQGCLCGATIRKMAMEALVRGFRSEFKKISASISPDSMGPISKGEQMRRLLQRAGKLNTKRMIVSGLLGATMGAWGGYRVGETLGKKDGRLEERKQLATLIGDGIRVQAKKSE